MNIFRRKTAERDTLTSGLQHMTEHDTISSSLQHITECDTISSGLQHMNSPGSVLNGVPTRRVKTPPGFSGLPRGHKESSPLRQFTGHYESPQAYYESHTNPAGSPLSFTNSSALRRGRDSPLGCLGSPLASGISALGGGGVPARGGNGSPLTAPVSPICRSHTRLFQ